MSDDPVLRPGATKLDDTNCARFVDRMVIDAEVQSPAEMKVRFTPESERKVIDDPLFDAGERHYSFLPEFGPSLSA